jgi:hypothetical protein
MPRYYEADRNTLLSIGLLSASVQSALSKIRMSHRVTVQQKRILANAKSLTEEIRNGKLSKPPQHEHLDLPKPTAAKVRKFAISAWTTSQSQNRNFDDVMENYLQLFDEMQRTGILRQPKQEVAIQAGIFFGKLNQVVVDKLNGLVEEEVPSYTISAR